MRSGRLRVPRFAGDRRTEPRGGDSGPQSCGCRTCVFRGAVIPGRSSCGPLAGDITTCLFISPSNWRPLLSVQLLQLLLRACMRWRAFSAYLTEWVGVAYALNSCYRHVCARARRTGCRCWVHCLALPTPSSQRVTTAGAFSGRRPPAWPCQSCCWTAPPHHSRLTRSIQRGSQWMATADLASAPRPAESTYFDCTRNVQHYKNLIIPVHFIHHCRHATSPETASESKWAHRSPHHSGSFLQSHDGGCHSR